MKGVQSQVFWGILLVVVGLLALFGSLGILGGVMTAVWILLLAAAGAGFLYVFLADRARWWAVIPGLTLLGMAILVALNALFPAFGDVAGGTIFLGAIGLSFWIVYLVKREHWWAIIPGGVLVTLALVAGIDAVPGSGGPGGSIDAGGVFFLGLGMTFLLVALLPVNRAQTRWAFIPAAVLLIFGLVLAARAAAILQYVWPAALVLGGLYLVLRGFLPRPQE